MTLILGCTTPDFLYMVSDRRVTRSDSGLPATDNENKAVFLHPHRILGYSGHAQIGGEPTDSWVVRLLSKERPENYVRVLQAAATLSFKKIRSYRHHSFLIVGWTADPRSSRKQVFPEIVVISNCWKPEVGLLKNAEDGFTVFRRWFKGPFTNLIHTGQGLSTSDVVQMRRTISRYLKQNSKRPDVVLQMLANRVRAVASKNSTVGSNLMAVCFPRVAIDGGSALISPLDRPTISHSQITALYMPEVKGPEIYMPSIVGPPGRAIYGLKLTIGKTDFDNERPPRRPDYSL